MRQFEYNERKDKTAALLVTLIIHGAILAALLFLGAPDKSVPGVTPNSVEIAATTKAKA